MKLTIRKMNENDLKPLHILLSNPEVMRFLEPPFSLEQTKDFLEYAGLSSPPLIYAVDDENGDFIGYVIYHEYDESSNEIGWVLKPNVWGRGYACELTAMLIQNADKENKHTVIECSPKQTVTKTIAEKFGFSYAETKNGLEIYIRKQNSADIS